MTDRLPRNSGEGHHFPIFVPTGAASTPPRRRWWRRHSPSTIIIGILLTLAIGASFIYAFRTEAAREAAVTKGSH